MDTKLAQPIAIVLGSDMKPAKVRMASQTDGAISDIWLLEGEAKPFEKYIKHLKDRWVIGTYNWLPLVDMHNNIVKDGTVVVHASFLPAGVAFKQLESSNQKQKSLFEVCDAKGNRKHYESRILWELANENTNCDIFCNLDYTRLMEKGRPGFYPLNGHSRFTILDGNLSQDLAEVKASLLQQGVAVSGGSVKLTTEFFNSDTVFLAENWSHLEIKAQNANCSCVSFPKEIYQAHIDFDGCKRLRVLSLPEQVTATHEDSRFYLYVFDCPLLEALWLPHTIMCSATIIVRNCESLKEIRVAAGAQRIVHGVSLSVKSCPNLDTVEVKNYDCNSMSFENTPLKMLVCQSQSFTNGYNAFSFNPVGMKLPRIVGLS